MFAHIPKMSAPDFVSLVPFVVKRPSPAFCLADFFQGLEIIAAGISEAWKERSGEVSEDGSSVTSGRIFVSFFGEAEYESKAGGDGVVGDLHGGFGVDNVPFDLAYTRYSLKAGVTAAEKLGRDPALVTRFRNGEVKVFEKNGMKFREEEVDEAKLISFQAPQQDDGDDGAPADAGVVFDWARETARLVGTVAHRALARMDHLHHRLPGAGHERRDEPAECWRRARALRHIGRAQKFVHLIRSMCWRALRPELRGFDPRASLL